MSSKGDAPLVPGPAPRTAKSAVTALVLAVGSYVLCAFGPIAAVAAIALGIGALREVRRSEGRVTGGALGLSAIILGVFNLVASAGLLVAFAMRADMSPSTTTAPASPPVAPLPPVAPPVVAPAPGSGEGGQMTVHTEVTEVKIGRVTLVDVPAKVESLTSALEAQRERAKREQKTLVLFTTRGHTPALNDSYCRPCMSIAAVLHDPKMQAALENVRLVRVDVTELREEVEDLRIPTGKIPGFYLLGPTLEAEDGITGAEWDDDTAANAAPVLSAFVRHKYPMAKRKEPFALLQKKPKPASPKKPPPTWL